ncbi:MAG: class I SAM-dependent methyltransferase [Pirellula sp.]|nr:class I SAM-dependent methyltransferase [Pirellula sp.]
MRFRSMVDIGTRTQTLNCMSIGKDLKILYHLALRPIRGKTHSERMENFYSGQAEGYDDFRKRLLQGREDVYQELGENVDGGTWVDFGGGTGSNLEFIGASLSKFQKVYVVDLAESLLGIVNKRCRKNNWTNVEAIAGDATAWTPPEGSVDVVTFSYSLTMIPDWFAAIDNAIRILKPGGHIGVIDFYVARKYPMEGLVKHGWSTRSFWPVWFSSDNVFPSPDHIPYLQKHFETTKLKECRAKVPYLPLVRTPYYQFVGKKK